MVHGSRVGIDGKAYGVVVSMLGVRVLVLVGILFIIPIVIRVMDWDLSRVKEWITKGRGGYI